MMTRIIETDFPPAGTGFRNLVWGTQYVISLVFLIAGGMKAAFSFPELAHIMPWTADAPHWLVRTIGLIDLAGGIGLVLPAWTRILPELMVPAAVGCTTVLTLAVPFHAYRGELLGVTVNLPLALISAFVLWARWKLVPISLRQERRA